MEIVAVFAGLWVVLVGAYIAVALGKGRRERARPGLRTGESPFGAQAGIPVEPALGSLSSEVYALRFQLETLRSEMSALNGEPRAERARLRRYRPGQYTELPRTLRRQVREVRSFRRPIHI